MIRILLCDDQAIVREGLARILGSDPQLQVVGMAADGAEALEMVEKEHPDLVLMDLKMPVMNGIIATRKLRERQASVFVLVLTTYDDDEWVFDAVRAGASGYLLKDAPPGELIRAIKGTVEGKTYIDPGVAGKVLSAAAHKKNPLAQAQFGLTEREREVLVLMTKGLTNAEIARRLYLSEGTVRNYTSEIFRKLGVNDRTQAVVVAFQNGLDDQSTT